MDIVEGKALGGKVFRLVQSFLGPTMGRMQLRSSKSPEAKKGEAEAFPRLG